MNTRRQNILAAFAAMTLAVGVASAAEEAHQHKDPIPANPSGDTGRHEPGMHMHKSDITHAKPSELAAEFKGEASELRAQAESHRKMASLYRTKVGSSKGAPINYEIVAKHCDQLAKKFDEAAAAAESAASELSK